jgi:A/G-specific adenine glycosylase
LLSLKGVGAYTAAAIGSFAFGLPQAVVDGNVLRVLSRYFGINSPIDETSGKAEFSKLAQELINPDHPAMYNQAIMDFGATMCKPMQPRCNECNLSLSCVAYLEGKQSEYPVKSPKKKPKNRWFYYLLITHQGSFLVTQRTGKGIWENLHEFILKEETCSLEKNELINASYWKLDELSPYFQDASLSDEFTHQLTHQRIFAKFLKIEIDNKFEIEAFQWRSSEELRQLAFPRLITKYLEMT